MKIRVSAVLAAVIVALSMIPGQVLAADPPRPDRPLPDSLRDLKLRRQLTVRDGYARLRIDRSLVGAAGPRDVIVRLKGTAVGALAARGGTAQRTQLRANRRQQTALVATARSADRGVRVLGQSLRTLNAVMLRVDGAALAKLAADPTVMSIRPISNYRLALSGTVPYIGGSTVRRLGFTGAGVRVAVIDSGIDYTHASLGGPGSTAAYAAAYGTEPADPRNTTTDGLFPTAKVVGGYDFVGEAWTGESVDEVLAPDPDPIDYEGHGTHVADIIGGRSGVAPGVALYAYKVCSAVGSGCSGVALLEAIDAAVDPNGDGDTSDHVDVINLSIGADYGSPFDDDLSNAVDLATGLGVLTVASAGNGGNLPYITGTPAAATTALSVAETEVPSASLQLLRVTSPAAIAGDYAAVFQPWSGALRATITAPVQFADGRGGNPTGCVPFPAGSLTGRIVLVDRGDCPFSDKIANIQGGGGRVGLIGLVSPGDPFGSGFGGGAAPTIPGYMISEADSARLQSILVGGGQVRATLNPANRRALVGHVVGSSSRGPSSDNRLKPEIAAPGASISAVAGSGNGTRAFGGTSGAAPMITGSAALLVQAYPARSPAEIKSVLMNSAETTIVNTSAGRGLAPITRIGGGEVRVDRALGATVAAWDTRSGSGGISFGFLDVRRPITSVTRTVRIRNYSARRVTYRISPSFRFANDRANGAVRISAPRTVTIPANGSRDVPVTLLVLGTRLRGWTMDAGENGANAAPLTLLEYDGYLWLDNIATKADDADPLHVAWQFLPRQASDVSAAEAALSLDGSIDLGFGPLEAGSTTLRNRGVGVAHIDAYSLLATSPDLPVGTRGARMPVIDLKAFGTATFPVDPGYCSDQPSFVMAFAVSTWERQTEAIVPASFEIDLDTDGDGSPDYAVFTYDLALGTGSADGRNAVWVADLATDDVSVYFYTDHPTNSSNTVMLICAEQIGLNQADFFRPMTADVFAIDAAYTANVTDSMTGIPLSPLGERYFGIIGDDGFGAGDITRNGLADLTVVDFGPTDTNPGELGLLLVLDAARPTGRTGAPPGAETLHILVKPGSPKVTP